MHGAQKDMSDKKLYTKVHIPVTIPHREIITHMNIRKQCEEMKSKSVKCNIS